MNVGVQVFVFPEAKPTCSKRKNLSPAKEIIDR